MGSIIEINDTLQITAQQGFPGVLNLSRHFRKPLKAEYFKNKIFDFKNKSGTRIYQVSPVRVFLAQNIKGKWLYWGLVEITEVNHDYKSKKTSGKFKLKYIYTPDEMKLAHKIIDRNKRTNYFN